jgi:hypothetical protein
VFVSDIRFERDVGAPLISLNILTGHRVAVRKVRRSFHQTAADGDTGLRRRMPVESPLRPLEIRVQAIKLSPCHAGPLARHPRHLGLAASFLTCSGPLTVAGSG